MNKVELLAPAGDLEKLKIAIAYGADAVFIGGKHFSLRAKASNFELEDIKEGVIFAHKHNAKVHVTVNIYPHEEDLEKDNLDEYLLALDKCGVDAIIVSSIYIMRRAKELGCKYEIHASTQESIANEYAIDFFKNLGVNRIVLAREETIEELKELKEKVNLPLEVFIHGGLCSSFSGRCSLSNYLTLRDANRGGCAHSCRWFYELKNNGKIVSNGEEPFRIGSKDLCAIEKMPELIKLGIDSFKIEGRMKSLNYIACIVKAYRLLIDDVYSNNFNGDFSKYKEIISKAENRETTLAWLKGNIDNSDVLYNKDGEKPIQDFIGIVSDYDKEKHLVEFYERNYLSKGETIAIMQPNKDDLIVKVEKMYDEEMNEIDVARHAMQKVFIEVSEEIGEFAIIKKA